MEDLSKLAEPEQTYHSERQTLLRKYDIPVSYLDFDYVKKCADGRELEKILHILQSGEEGHFPDLIKATEERLAAIKPNSKYIRKVTPVLNKAYLNKEDREHLSQDLSTWLDNVKLNNEELSKFGKSSNANIPEIRKKETLIDKRSENSTKRIRSTDYSSWDKYDPDTEILKMDLDAEKLKREIASKPKEPTKRVKFNEFHTRAEANFEAEREKEKGNEYYRIGDYKQAYVHYTNSINYSPSCVNYNNRAITNIKLKEYESAIKDCRCALKYDAKNIKALLRLSQSYEYLKQYEDAIVYAEKSIEIEPNNTLAQTAVNRLNELRNSQTDTLKKRMKIVEIDSKSDEKETTKNKNILDEIFKEEEGSKIVEIRDTAKPKNCVSSNKFLSKKTRDYILLPIPGPSFMPEPYFIKVENKDQSLIKRQEYILNNRQQTLYYTNIDEDEDDCEVIHLKKSDSKYSFNGDSVTIKVNERINLKSIENLIKVEDISSTDASCEDDLMEEFELNKLNLGEKVVESSNEIDRNSDVKLPDCPINITNGNNLELTKSEEMMNVTTDQQAMNRNFRDGAGEPNNIDDNHGFRIRPNEIDNPYAFTKYWNCVYKDCTGNSIAQLLRNINSDLIPYLIGCKLDGSMFRLILRTLYQHFSVPHEIVRVKAILTNLTNVPRFDLNILFLSAEDKNTLNCMVQFLEQHGNPLADHIKEKYLI